MTGEYMSVPTAYVIAVARHTRPELRLNSAITYSDAEKLDEPPSLRAGT